MKNICIFRNRVVSLYHQKGASRPDKKSPAQGVKVCKNKMEAKVSFMFNGKMLSVLAKCGDTKGLSDALIGEKLEAQIHRQFPGAVIISISFNN